MTSLMVSALVDGGSFCEIERGFGPFIRNFWQWSEMKSFHLGLLLRLVIGRLGISSEPLDTVLIVTDSE